MICRVDIRDILSGGWYIVKVGSNTLDSLSVSESISCFNAILVQSGINTAKKLLICMLKAFCSSTIYSF